MSQGEPRTAAELKLDDLANKRRAFAQSDRNRVLDQQNPARAAAQVKDEVSARIPFEGADLLGVVGVGLAIVVITAYLLAPK